MTATHTAEATECLDQYDFNVQCDLCVDTAGVSCQGCCDKHTVLLCRPHFYKLNRWWLDKIRAGTMVCEGCYRPVLHFDTHFTVHWL